MMSRLSASSSEIAPVSSLTNATADISYKAPAAIVDLCHLNCATALFQAGTMEQERIALHRSQIPTLDRLPPDHPVHDLMTLPLNPLFRCPRGRHRDGQQQARANDIHGHLANRGPKHYRPGPAARADLIRNGFLSLPRLRWSPPYRHGNVLRLPHPRHPPLHPHRRRVL